MHCFPFFNKLTTDFVRTRFSKQLTPFDDDIIIFNIIPFLDQNDMIRFASVCSSWRQSCLSPNARKEFKTFYYYILTKLKYAMKLPIGDLPLLFTDFDIQHDITKSQFKSIIQSPKVTSFKTLNFYSSTFKGNYYSNIRSLEITCVKLTNNDVLLVMKCLKELKNLKLSSNGLKQVDLNWFQTLESLSIRNPINDNNVKQILKPNSISNLKELELSIHENKTKHNVDFDATLFPNLTSLSLDGLLLHEKTITSILNSGINFKTFQYYPTENLGTEIDELICKYFSKQTLLENFVIGESGAAFKYLNGNNLKQLTVFDIQNISSTEDFPLMENLLTCTLHNNRYNNYTPSNFYQFQQFCNSVPNLTSLNIYIQLSCSLEPLTCLSNLKHLLVVYFNINDIKFISKIRSLESLELSDQIDNMGIHYISKGELLNLKELRISHRANIETMKMFDDGNLKNLRYLRISFLVDALDCILNSSFMKQIRVLYIVATDGIEFDTLVSWLRELNLREIILSCYITRKQRKTLVELCRGKRIRLILIS